MPMPAMVTGSVTESAQMRRLVEFASDVAELADRRCDAELRKLIDSLHGDLLALRADED
jgi:hypothetical protein